MKIRGYLPRYRCTAPHGYVAHGCTLALLCVTIASCNSKKEEPWTKSPGVEVSVVKEYEDGKPYLTVFYENFGADTIQKIRYEYITVTHGHTDTTLKVITPPELLLPKDRHTVPRSIGEDTVKADEVHVGEVWVMKKTL